MCERHRWTWRSQGEVNQRRVRATDVKKYSEEIARLVRKTSEKTEAALRELHAILLDHVQSVVQEADQGRRVTPIRLKAAREAARVLLEADPTRCALVVAGMYLLRDREPRRFVSDRGFLFQLVKRFRAQTVFCFGRYWSHTEGRSKYLYRCIQPRVVLEIGALLAEGYAPFVGHILRVAQRERERKQVASQMLAEEFSLSSTKE